MTAPRDAQIDALLTPPGRDVVADEDRARLAAADADTPVVPPARAAADVDPLELDRMMVAASLGYQRPPGLSAAAVLLWPQLLDEVREILARPGRAVVDYPSEAVDAG